MSLAWLGGWLMTAAGGLFAGAILLVAVERTNQWRRMPIEQYAIDFRRSLYRVDPLIPILGITSGVGAILFALNSGRPPLLAWTALGLIGLIIIGSAVIAEPINAKFRRLPEGRVPDGAEQLRVAWRRFHAIRTLVALAAFALIAAAVAT